MGIENEVKYAAAERKILKEVFKFGETRIAVIRNTVILALCPLILSLGMTVVNYNSISTDDKYSMPFELSRKVDEANVTTISGIGIKAQILNLDKLDTNAEDAQGTSEVVDTDIKNVTVYNEIAGDVQTWGGRIASEDFKKYQFDLESVNGVIVNSIVDKENGTVTYTFKNGQAIVSDVNIEPDKTRTFDREVPDESVGSQVEKVDEHSTKTIYDNGVVVYETLYVDCIDAPTSDDLSNRPIKLNYKISWANVFIGYVYALLVEVVACMIYFTIRIVKFYFKVKKENQA